MSGEKKREFMMIYPNREMKKSIKEQVEEMLFEDIVCGVYPPGTV